jgi:hypothetical protein
MLILKRVSFSASRQKPGMPNQHDQDRVASPLLLINGDHRQFIAYRSLIMEEMFHAKR